MVTTAWFIVLPNLHLLLISKLLPSNLPTNNIPLRFTENHDYFFILIEAATEATQPKTVFQNQSTSASAWSGIICTQPTRVVVCDCLDSLLYV